MKAVYKIENQKTGDIYIGSSVDYDYRRWIHLHRLRKGNHHSAILQNSWNKHGETSFLFSVLESVNSDELLIEREQYYIDTLAPRYNIAKKAGSPLGTKHTYESRMNMSIAHKKLTAEQRGHKEGCKCCICLRPKGENDYRYIKREQRKCECGCGNTYICKINSTRRFINGHNNSKKKNL